MDIIPLSTLEEKVKREYIVKRLDMDKMNVKILMNSFIGLDNYSILTCKEVDECSNLGMLNFMINFLMISRNKKTIERYLKKYTLPYQNVYIANLNMLYKNKQILGKMLMK